MPKAPKNNKDRIFDAKPSFCSFHAVPSQSYDICVLALSDLRTDARSLNIAQALAATGRRVCAITPDWSQGAQFDGIDLYTVPCQSEGRLYKKWLRFTREVHERYGDLKARSYWAEDLWVLRAAAKLSRRHKAKLLYDSREIYSALGELHHRVIMQSVVATMERRYARFVDRIIVSGELDAEYIRQHLRRREKPSVIMNVPPFQDVARGDLLRQRFHIPATAPVIAYQGAVLMGRGIDLMMRCMKDLPECHFCVMGDGPDMQFMHDLRDQLGLQHRVHFTGSIPYKELLQWTASADVGLCFVEPISLSYKLALPNKLFEYAMAGTPALVSDLPAMRRVIEQYPFGELLPADASIEHIVNALRQLAQQPGLYRAAAARAAKVFNREAQLQRIADVADELERLP